MKPTRTASRMWRIELESGECFTVTAENKGEAIKKAVAWRPRTARVAKVENVAEIIAAGKYKKP